MSDGMVLFGDSWLRVGFIEAVRPIDKEIREDDYWAYGVRVVMISGRLHTHWVSDVVQATGQTHRHVAARQKRDEFLDEFLGRMKRAMGVVE